MKLTKKKDPLDAVGARINRLFGEALEKIDEDTERIERLLDANERATALRDRYATMLAWLTRDLAMIVDSDVPTTDDLRDLLHYYMDDSIRGPMCDRLPEPTIEGEAKA